MTIRLIDETGKETILPARNVMLRCDGRKELVTAAVELDVAEIDVELDREQTTVDASGDVGHLARMHASENE